jgi:hypothetical protein
MRIQLPKTKSLVPSGRITFASFARGSGFQRIT